MRLTTVGTFSPDLLLRYLYKFAQRYMEYVCVCARVCVCICASREKLIWYVDVPDIDTCWQALNGFPPEKFLVSIKHLFLISSGWKREGFEIRYDLIYKSFQPCSWKFDLQKIVNFVCWKIIANHRKYFLSSKFSTNLFVEK